MKITIARNEGNKSSNRFPQQQNDIFRCAREQRRRTIKNVHDSFDNWLLAKFTFDQIAKSIPRRHIDTTWRPCRDERTPFHRETNNICYDRSACNNCDCARVEGRVFSVSPVPLNPDFKFISHRRSTRHCPRICSSICSRGLT